MTPTLEKEIRERLATIKGLWFRPGASIVDVRKAEDELVAFIGREMDGCRLREPLQRLCSALAENPPKAGRPAREAEIQAAWELGITALKPTPPAVAEDNL